MTRHSIFTILLGIIATATVFLAVSMLYEASKENNPHDKYDGRSYYWGGVTPELGEERTNE